MNVQPLILKALNIGAMTSHELARHTGLTQSQVINAAKRLLNKGEITSETVKSGQYWVSQYALKIHVPKPSQTVFCGIQTQGIFSPAEYRAMRAQANKLFGKHDFSKDITNNQSI